MLDFTTANNRTKWLSIIESNAVSEYYQEVINKFFIEDNISFEKYNNNQTADNDSTSVNATPTFKKYYAGAGPTSRGLFIPSWYYFAYPDVQRWYGDNIDTDIFKKYFSNEDFVSKYVEADNNLSLNFFRIVIDEFKLHHSKLECEVDKELDVDLGNTPKPYIIPSRNLNSARQNQHKTQSEPLFPTNIYIGHILNDGLHLSSDDFEIKYSRIAKKVKNITNDFGNPSIKYIIKGNFFGDDEVIIYERNSMQADIAVSHMCTDHIHWKNITDYLASKPEFKLFEDSYLEKNYVLQQNGYSLPEKISFIRVLCSIVGKIGMVVLNVNFR